MVNSSERSGSDGGRAAWLERARRAYLERGNGLIEADGAELFVRRGEIHVDRDGEIAAGLREALERARQAARPAADEPVRRAVSTLAERLVRADGGVSWSDETPPGVELLGPLPLVVFLLAAVENCGERRLLDLLGGESARLRTRDETPALGQLPGLEPDMARLISQLERPTSVADLLRGGDRTTLLRALAKLWIVGLAGTGPVESGVGLVPQKTLDRFLERIAESLDAEPVDTDPEAHRREIARFVSEAGERDHYRLLEIDADAADGDVLAAFERRARHFHPRHAARLGLAGKEATLRLLFERATDAYLTLSDPLRRSSYDTLIGHHREIEIGDEQRAHEKRAIARQHFLRGSSALAEMDYSTAVDLLKEAARVDPKPEYFARLAQAQAKNPRWRRHAVESYGKALELKEDDAGLHLGLAAVLEAVDEPDTAREHYARALELMPENPAAQVGLERLGGVTGSSGGLRAALTRRKSGG